MMHSEHIATRGDAMLHALHDEHAAALWAFALRLTGGDRAAAEDVVQETLLRAWKNPGNPVFATEESRAVRSWLYTVARRIVIDDWRARSIRPERLMAETPEAEQVTDHAETVVRRRLVTDALTTLSPEHRAVLFEVYFAGSTVAEAARTLGIPEGTVKSRTHYALRAFTLALAEQGVHE